MHWQSRPLRQLSCQPHTNMHHKHRHTSNKQVPHSATKAISPLKMLLHAPPTPTTHTCHLPRHMHAPRPPPSTATPSQLPTISPHVKMLQFAVSLEGLGNARSANIAYLVVTAVPYSSQEASEHITCHSTGPNNWSCPTGLARTGKVCCSVKSHDRADLAET